MQRSHPKENINLSYPPFPPQSDSSLDTSTPNPRLQSKLIEYEDITYNDIIKILTILQEASDLKSEIRFTEINIDKKLYYPVVKYEFKDDNHYIPWRDLVMKYELDNPLRKHKEIIDMHNVCLPKEFMYKLIEICKKKNIYPIRDQKLPPQLDREKIRLIFTKLTNAFEEGERKISEEKEKQTQHSQRSTITDMPGSSLRSSSSQPSSFRPSSSQPEIPSRLSLSRPEIPLRPSSSQPSSSQPETPSRLSSLQSSSSQPSSSQPSSFRPSSSQQKLHAPLLLSQRPLPPPPPPRPLEPPSRPKQPIPKLPVPPPLYKRQVIFPDELQIIKIVQGTHNLIEEFQIGFPNAEYSDLTRLSSVLQTNAQIKSKDPVIYTAKDGSLKESYNKTVHTDLTDKYYYIILTFENIQTIINNFENLKLKGVSGNQILKFLNKIYAAMITYKTDKTDPKTKITPEFNTFLSALMKFINDKNVEIATELSLQSHRYKYLKYKMKYLELKNKNKL